MAVNKLLPFANGSTPNVVDYDTWSSLSQILGNGFVTGIARSDYANRLFSQGALASYILGEFVVEQTAQDADLDESVFYTNFKNALINYIKANAVSLDTAQTVGGVKTFTSSPIVPTADAADNSQKVASTAFVQGEIASKADDSDVVKLTGNQTIAGTKTFSDSPEVPTPASGDNSQKTASTGFVQNAVSSQAVKFDSAQTLTDAQKTQARSNIGAPADSEVVKLTGDQTIDDIKTFTSDIYGSSLRARSESSFVRIFAETITSTDRSAQVIASKVTSSENPGCVIINAPKTDLSDSNSYVFGYDGMTSPRPITCPTPANGDDSTTVATTAFAENVVASGTNYIRYKSGLQICFDSFFINPGSQGKNITYPVPFVAVASVAYEINQYVGRGAYSRTATGFQAAMQAAQSSGTDGYYIAIGYWK